MTEQIPQPPGLPVLGNLRDVDPENGLQSLIKIAERYGPIFKLDLPGRTFVVIANYELCNEVCDEKRFRKGLSAPLYQVRNGVGAGLFTALHGEHDWEIAHRTLTPAFGPLPIKDMFDEMHDIASQLVMKWSKFGSSDTITVVDDYTRLTLDSIALCAMDTRFNSYYHDNMHPFVQAMGDFLAESGRRASRPAVAQYFMRESNRKYQADIDLMQSVARQVLDQRRTHPTDKKDLLNAMVKGKDPKTGEALSDQNIMNNMITFLIAGHETTSGLLSFTTYFLLKNPSAYRQLQEEVDEVLGTGPMRFEHIAKMPYLQACLRESLRLMPTASAFTRVPHDAQGCVIGGGKYQIPPGITITCLLPQIQRDPAVYGEDAASFRPSRWLGAEGEKIPSGAWKPFGTGPRACIGRPFAWQEAIMAVAMILQNFDLRLVDPSYEVRIKQTLTIKPDGLQIHAVQRGDHSPGQLERRLYGGSSATLQKSSAPVPRQDGVAGRHLSIFYGGNTGTCEGLAQSLAGSATGHGFIASVSTLDSAAKKLPKDQPVVIITASFEGEPADNAAQFVEWMTHQKEGSLEGVQYAVFGCGHRDWASTYQKIPKRIDSTLEQKGAKRILDRHGSDVAGGTVLDDFDNWQDEHLWPSLGGDEDSTALSGTNALNVELTTSVRAETLKQSVNEALVIKSEVLSGPGVEEKWLAQFKLPTGVTYNAGDYLNVLPLNHPMTVRRVLKRFDLPWDSEITIQPGSHTSLPVGKQTSVFLLLSTYVELGNAATKKNILSICALAEDPQTRSKIESLAVGESSKSVSLKSSVLEILESYPDVHIPFGLYLSMLPPMRIRQYSISSSPLVDPTVVSITYHVLASKKPESPHEFLGVTTNYLKRLEPGDRAQVALKASHYSFHLPSDNSKPVIMVCAGTGLAPFRAFVEERAAKISSGQTLGAALLFIGCQNPESDRLYADEFESWHKLGAVELFYAFSRKPEASKGCKYTQERIISERERVLEVFDAGAKVFVCGASRLGYGVQEASMRIHKEEAEKRGKAVTEAQAKEWFDSLKVQERWSSDIFG